MKACCGSGGGRGWADIDPGLESEEGSPGHWGPGHHGDPVITTPANVSLTEINVVLLKNFPFLIVISQKLNDFVDR